MLNSIISNTLTVPVFIFCTAASLAFGFAIALTFMIKNTYNKGFIMTLILLPAAVQLIIMLVNGNIGTGVAIAGAFSLVKFRSVAGGAREICSIFLAMALGLATGMGYLAAAAIFFAVVGGVTVVLSLVRFGEGEKNRRELRITIPENMEYDGVFDDIFRQYTTSSELFRVKTTNMGSLYELRYNIVLRNNTIDKAFLDALRCRNGNLVVSCGPAATDKEL